MISNIFINAKKLDATNFDETQNLFNLIIEKIKNIVIETIHHSEEKVKVNFSHYLSEKLNEDYASLANLFSEVQGITIEKFLIFHDSDLSFGREPSIFVEPIPKQFLKKKVTYIKVRPILETKIYLGLNSKVKVNLSPTKKPLDLMQDNPAVLKYDYRKLSSSGF